MKISLLQTSLDLVIDWFIDSMRRLYHMSSSFSPHATLTTVTPCRNVFAVGRDIHHCFLLNYSLTF